MRNGGKEGIASFVYLKRLGVLLLTFIDNSEAKVDFVCLVRLRVHAHDGREGLLCVLD